MKKTSKILLSSILAIALCLSLIAGSTFALFTSESSVNIAVTSGKVEVVASLEVDKLYSIEADSAGTILDENGATYKHAEQTGAWKNGGTASVEADGTLSLENITAGDKVDIKLNITNNSTVTVKYRILAALTGDEELGKALVYTIDDEQYTNATSYTSTWKVFGENISAPISIELPATSTLQQKTCNIAITVQAVQGNAYTADDSFSAYAVADNKLYKTNGFSYAELSADELNALEGKLLVKNGADYEVSDQTIKQLSAAASDGDTLDIYLIKGENYIIDNGSSSGVINLNITGLSDYDGNKMSGVQLYNSANTETHAYDLKDKLSLTVKNTKLIGEDEDANGDRRCGAGFEYVANLLVEDCEFTKSQCLWCHAGYTYTIKNSTFIGEGNKYSMWTRGAGTWNFEGCAFNTQGKALKIYASTGTVNVKDCKFYSTNSAASKAAIEIDAALTVNISGITVNEHNSLYNNNGSKATVNVD